MKLKYVKQRRSPPKQVITNTTDAESEWITVLQACKEAHRSKPVMYSWINQGLIESFVSQVHPDSMMGLRLIRRSSLRAFLERQFRDAQINRPVVRYPVRKKEVVA